MSCRLLAAKSPSYSDIDDAVQTMANVVRESSTHKSFCAEWGITADEIEQSPESPATTAYGAYLIDIGLQGDTLKLIMALAACLIGYGEVGLWLKRHGSTPGGWVKLDGNPYLKWIDVYSGKDYQSAVKRGIGEHLSEALQNQIADVTMTQEIIEARAAADAPSETRLNEWKAVWEKCTRLEKQFWDMAMSLS